LQVVVVVVVQEARHLEFQDQAVAVVAAALPFVIYQHLVYQVQWQLLLVAAAQLVRHLQVMEQLPVEVQVELAHLDRLPAPQLAVQTAVIQEELAVLVHLDLVAH
jgi:hypothetical protein